MMQDFDTLMSAIMPVENDPDPDSIYRKFWQERDQYTVQIAWRVCIAIHPRIVGYKFYQTMLNWDVRFAVATEKEYRNMLMKQRALAPAGVRSAFKPVKQMMADRRLFPLAICEGTGKRSLRLQCHARRGECADKKRGADRPIGWLSSRQS